MTTLITPQTFTAPNPFAPLAPLVHHAPQKVAEDTHLIRQLQGEGVAPMAVYVNSMVILGREPVVVDTGTLANERMWFNDLCSLVDPEDVRWIFISHDDCDHTGNLARLLEMCPNATLVSSWFQLERLTPSFNLPLDRMRWLNDGESFDAGDRTFSAIRPPIYDAPTTRGLYDSKTRVYWASDCFATPVLKPADEASELDREFWRQAFTMFHSLVSPWHASLDAAKFNRDVDRIAALDMKVAVSAHTPPVRGAQLSEAFDLIRALPGIVPAQMPGQSELEAMLASMTAHA